MRTGRLAIDVPEDDVVGSRIAADRVLRGRMPDTDRVDEVAINEATVDADRRRCRRRTDARTR